MSTSSSVDRAEPGTRGARSAGGGLHRPAPRQRMTRLVRFKAFVVRAAGDQLRRLAHGEYRPETLRSVPSWGMSVLFHGMLLLVLALLIQLQRSGETVQRPIQSAIVDTQLGEVTSLVNATRAGDPFTKENSLDPPSLGLEHADPELRLVGQPEIAGLARFAPELASPVVLNSTNVKASPLSLTNSTKGRALTLNGGVKLPQFAESITAPFSGRQGLTKAKLLRREGGTARSEKAVEAGLDWIARHQRADGAWTLDVRDQCRGEACPQQDMRLSSDTAATGLALLPLMGAGNIHTVKCKHQESVRRGLEWLMSHQQANGDLFTGPPGIPYLYSHAIGSMALCEAYALSRDPSLEGPARSAIAFILAAQDPDGGGWRYSPGMPGDTSVFGWNIFALRSAHLAGIKIPGKSLKLCSNYLDQAATDKRRVTYSYQPGRLRGDGSLDPVMTAEALLGRQLLGWPREFPPLVKGVGMISAHLQQSGDRNIYYWYYATQLLHNMGGPSWERWNVKIREGLIAMQEKEHPCAHGSWDPFQPQPDTWSRTAGRLYLTSLSVLTLEVYYRYLPMYRAYDEDQAKPAGAMKADDKPK